MTIEFTSPWETKSLVQRSQAIFYPARLPSQHHQLKNYISTAGPDIIYYASSYEIYSLNTVTRKRALIKSLPWKPFCLDAAHGWICVGGDDNGQCAFISIDPGSGPDSRSHAEVDDLLPVDLDPEYRHQRQDLHRSLPWPHYPSIPKYEMQRHDLGGERVNSVKVEKLRNVGKGLQQHEIVAVMTNNDRTVRIWSLSQSRLLEALDFPTRMNHASISPDGHLLLAVGDEGPGDKIRAFFRKRVVLRSNAADGDVQMYPRSEWHEMAEPRLKHTASGNEEDACFCTAFSPSGHICVVASQSGYLTFFDTSQIREDLEVGDAVIAVLKSSRPSLPGLFWSGGVRSISFSPAPWDLFAWAEDQGRVCVVDLRNAFQSRQTIEIDTESTDIERVDVEDQDSVTDQRQLEIERRFVERHREALEAQDHLAAVSHTADYLEFTAERRRIESENTALRENLQALSPSERQMIDSIGLRRFQSSNLNSSDSPSTIPTSINYPPTRYPDPQNWATTPSPNLSSHPQSRSTASIHDFMRQRNWERSRTSDRSFQPRRRSSVVISNSNSASNSNHSSSSLAPVGTATPTLSTSPSRLPSASSELAIPHLFDTSDPWHTISDAMGSSNIPPDTVARFRSLQSRNTASTERRLQAAGTPQATIERRMQALQNARDRPRNESVEAIEALSNHERRMLALQNAARERPRSEHAEAIEAISNRARESNARARNVRASRTDAAYEEIDREVLLRRLDEPRRRPRNDEGIATMGIGWNVDGRSLFVGTEEGILEYPVNIEARKTFPCISVL